MSNRSIQEILSFNQEVVALAAAGLPLDLSSAESVQSKLEQSTAALALRVGRGQTLEQAIRDEPLLASNYRRALLTLLRCDDSRVAMESLFAPASSRRRFVSRIGDALIYPLIIATLAYFGFIYLCQVTLPSIESIYRQLDKSLPPVLAFLTGVKHWIPVWSLLVPLLLLLSIVWWKRRGIKKEWTWLPGSRRYYRASDHAQVADQLAGMLESGCTLEESLAAVTPTSVISVPNSKEVNSIDQFPSLLQWAIHHEPSAEGFRSVARTYRQLADQRERVWRFLVPTLVGLAVGGLIVLVYGLTLFLPMIQLLEDVAIPVAGRRGA